MSPYRDFAKDALILVAVCIGVAATPHAAAAQSQGQANMPVAVPYAGSGGPVDQQNLPPPNYAPQRYDAPSYAPPPPPPPPPPPSGYDQSTGARYAAQDGRDSRAVEQPVSYGPAEASRSDDRSGGGAQLPEKCQMVEQRAFFPDDTTQLTVVRACRDAHGRWRIGA